MIRAKEEWIREVHQNFQNEFENLREKIRTSHITNADEELIDRLRKISTVVDDLPVWPFDASTLRKFLTAYIVPLVVSLLGKFVPASLESLRQFFAK